MQVLRPLSEDERVSEGDRFGFAESPKLFEVSETNLGRRVSECRILYSAQYPGLGDRIAWFRMEAK